MIQIGIDPNIVEIGPLALTWHGALGAAAIAFAVWLIDRWGKHAGLEPGVIGSIAPWAIIGGLIGARAVYVLDNWGFFAAHPAQMFAITEGGIAVFGGIAGGAAAGAAYAARKGLPVRYLLDLSAPALILAQGVGRVGDIINGEHFSRTTGLPWGVVYTHPESPAFGMASQHPAVAYEMLADLALFALLWMLRGRLAPRGSLFMVYAALYGVIRLAFSFLRLDSNTVALGLNQQGWISLLVLVAALGVLAGVRPKVVSCDLRAPGVYTEVSAAHRGRRS